MVRCFKRLIKWCLGSLRALRITAAPPRAAKEVVWTAWQEELDPTWREWTNR